MKGARPADNVEAIRLLEEVKFMIDANNDLITLG
jgi:hypothetical protein